MAAEKIRHRDYMADIVQNPNNAVVTQEVVARHNEMLATLRETMTVQKDLLGYREYIQARPIFS